METLRHKGAAERRDIRVKTFVFDLDDCENGYADAEVNYFCESHSAMSIVLDRYNAKMIYRVLYRETGNED